MTPRGTDKINRSKKAWVKEYDQTSFKSIIR